jgi:hypothetical protein
MRSLLQLKILIFKDLPLLKEAPDLSNLPYLKRLDGCVELARLTNIGPLVALHHLNPNYCCSLKSMLNMSHSPQLLLFQA